MSLPSTHSAPNTESQPFTADVAREVTRGVQSDRIEGSLRIRDLATALKRVKHAAELGLSRTAISTSKQGASERQLNREEWKWAQLQDMGYNLELGMDPRTMTIRWGHECAQATE